METKTEVEIFSRKFIKPFSPTSPHKRNQKLSLLAQTYPSIYGSMIFFYTSNTNSNFILKSLSKTLVHFYPFAGRLKNDNLSIDCNDDGVYVVQAQIKGHLQNFLRKPDLKLLNYLQPTSDPQISKLPRKPISLIQLTTFSCGGTAISVCVSKKIADSSSLFSFITTWAAINRGLYESVEGPKFIGAPISPPADLPIMGREVSGGDDLGRVWATRRLVFDAKKLAQLKAQNHVKKPTNVELVSALVSKCAMVSAPESLTKTPSFLYRELNLKEITLLEPPLPETAVGNHVWFFPVMFEESYDKFDLFEVLVKIRKGLTEFCDDVANGFEGEDSFLLVREITRDPSEALKMGLNIYACSTSLCELPLYEVDFGFGKPIWVTSPMSFNNMFVLMETKWGKGIEVLVTLEEQHMAAFERDEELLEFASFNPSATSSYCRL